MILNLGQVADKFTDELVEVIHKYDETLHVSTVIGILELVKHQLIYDNMRDEDE